MRTHSQIIKDAGGDNAVAETLDAPLNTVRAWIQRNRISHTRWSEFVANGWSSFEELSAAVEPVSKAA